MRSFEPFFHAILHLAVLSVFFYLIFTAPLGISVLLIILEIVHLKILGNCFLTRFAHYRGIMTGMSFWEYVPFIFGIRDYKKAGFYIDLALKALIIVTISLRILRYYVT